VPAGNQLDIFAAGKIRAFSGNFDRSLKPGLFWLAIMKKIHEQVEVYQERTSSTEVRFSNGKAEEILSSILQGTALRLLKNGRMGFSYTRSESDPDSLIEGATASLTSGVEGPGSFTADSPVAHLDAWDPAIEDVTTGTMAEECRRVSDLLAGRIGGIDNGTVGCSMILHRHEIRIMTSGGVERHACQGFVTATPSLTFPGTGARLVRPISGKRFVQLSDESLDVLADLYQRAKVQVSVVGGRQRVLFMPSAMFTLAWRLIVGLSGRSILRKESPLDGRLGEPVFHPDLTLIDDPWDAWFTGARSFDDEGTATHPLTLVDGGILKSFFYDRLYACKAGHTPTGHGYKCAGGFEPNSLGSPPPQPSLQHLTIKEGTSDFSDLVQMIDRGVIVFCPLGAHSGNILNGDFSIGLAPGLVVENGRIIGRARDAMVSGNAYDLFQNVMAIGNTLEKEFTGTFPPVLFDWVSVSG